jgi:hypothetical protein
LFGRLNKWSLCDGLLIIMVDTVLLFFKGGYSIIIF